MASSGSAVESAVESAAARPGGPPAGAGTERFEVVVVGGGQAGLSVGYHLARRGLRFVILDAHARIGDAWRTRWDSLRLFTPARFDGLAGMPFPAPAHAFPTKDAMADYLEAYAARFALPVRTGVAVDRLSRSGGRFVLAAGARRFEAEQVVVAMSDWQRPRLPPFAPELDPGIVQLHSSAYRNPAQLRAGGVLVVGAGNSGAEIALDVAPAHRTWLSGRATGHLPFRIDGPVARLLLRPLFRGVFHRLLTVDTPVGRRARPKLLARACRSSASGPGTWPPPRSSASPGPWACGTGGPCWRTAARWRWRTSSGAPDSTPASPGSISPSSRGPGRSTSAAWPPASPGCTSSAWPSSPRRPRP